MKMSNGLLIGAAIGFSLITGCVSKNSPTGPVTHETMGNTVSILKAAYATPTGNSLSVTIPAHLKCSGAASSNIADSTKTGPDTLKGNDSLKVALTVLMAGVSAIPTIDSATLATFASVLANPLMAGREMDGLFTRVNGGPGLSGAWAFVGLVLDPLVQAIIDQNPPLKTQVDSTIGMLTGQPANRILFLEFVTDSISVFINKGWYGQQMVMGITDTTRYGIAVATPDLSHWQLRGKTTSDTVSITINDAGNLNYVSSNGSYAAYTYLLQPAACPDDQAPAWWAQFLSTNPH
jgi:hypothetical protein